MIADGPGAITEAEFSEMLMGHAALAKRVGETNAQSPADGIDPLKHHDGFSGVTRVQESAIRNVGNYPIKEMILVKKVSSFNSRRLD